MCHLRHLFDLQVWQDVVRIAQEFVDGSHARSHLAHTLKVCSVGIVQVFEIACISFGIFDVTAFLGIVRFVIMGNQGYYVLGAFFLERRLLGRFLFASGFFGRLARGFLLARSLFSCLAFGFFLG
ncbi:hypothetical protein D1872_233070 [compost metagenome]